VPNADGLPKVGAAPKPLDCAPKPLLCPPENGPELLWPPENGPPAEADDCPKEELPKVDLPKGELALLPNMDLESCGAALLLVGEPKGLELLEALEG